MSVLRLKGKRVASLAEFRDNFDFNNVKDYLYQGRLTSWLRNLGEKDLADELDELKNYDYSDQTLLDNFTGIFELKSETAQLPAKENLPEKTDFLPPVPLPAQKLPSVFEAKIEHIEECAYADSAVCFRDSRVNIEQSLTMYKVTGNTPRDLHQYMKNKMALKILREVVLSTLPSDIHERFGYQIEITKDTSFTDLGLNKEQLQVLAGQLSERFGVYFSACDEYLCCQETSNIYYKPFTVLKCLSEAGNLSSYTDDEAVQLLEEGF